MVLELFFWALGGVALVVGLVSILERIERYLDAKEKKEEDKKNESR